MQSMSLNPMTESAHKEKNVVSSGSIEIADVTIETEEEVVSTSQESLTEDDELPLEFKLKTTDVTLMEKYVRLEKVKAAKRSKAGDKEGARVSFRNYKELDARLIQLKSAKEVKAEPVPKTLDLPPKAPQTSTSNDIKTLVKQRQVQYKQAALAYKKLNNMAKAKEMLIVSKQLDDALEQADMGLLPQTFQLPPIPVVEAQTTAPTPPEPTKRPSVSAANALAKETTPAPVKSTAPQMPSNGAFAKDVSK